MIYRPLSVLLYGAILVPVLGNVAAAVTTTWTFNGSGNWEDAAKWSNGVPNNNTFDVAIDDGDNAVTVTLDVFSRTINSLALGTDDTLVIRHTSTAVFETLTVANGFTNSGTIRLSGTGTGFPFSALAVTNGMVTNSATGLVDFQLGSSGSRRFTADMTNQGGTIQIDAPTTFNKTNGLVEQTSGTTNLNNTLSLAFGTQFKLSGGMLNSGSGTISGGGSMTNGFHYLGGTINGSLTIDGTRLTVGPSITGPFSFSFTGNSSLTLSNNLLAAGQTLTLQPAFPQNAILTSATGFTNQSSIILIPGTGSTTFWISNSDTLLNDTNGLIRVAPAFAAPHSTIRANILNQGTVLIESPTVFEKFNAVFTNNGQFTASGAFTFDSGRTFTQIGGTSLINASFGSPSANMPAEFSGGRLLGRGALFVPVVNSGASVEPGDSGVGNLSIRGSYTQQSGGSLIAEIGGTETSQYDVLTVIGAATLGGTLDVRLVNLGPGTYSPAAGDSFQILTATSGVASHFENLLLPPLDNDLSWNVIYSMNAVSLTVSAVPEPGAVTLCLVGMLMIVLFPRTTRIAFLR